jgi:folate-binding Fe-S cluster repair protein YgfZ
VQVTLLARKTDAGLGSVKGLVKSGTQIAVSSSLVLQEQLAWHTALFERNPNGNVQWTEAAFNAAEFGVESA